ncbi:MAG: TonB-dependent receptor [Acidobacteria bacterium]|nr:TonB-dependent receptor [Acidobacteriota bacterium]
MPSVDELQEFKIQTNTFSPQYGWSMGNAVNAITKSGSSAFHGGMFEFLRNDKLDANNFFSNRNGIPRRNFKRNQYGFNLGGPLFIPRLYEQKNRTFVFGSFEGLRQQTPLTAVLSVSTLEQRQGDFSGTLNANRSLAVIYNPFTTRLQGAGYLRDPFPGNRIPQQIMDPVALKLLPYWPEPNRTGDPVTHQDNFVGAASLPLNSDQYSLRVDHNLTDKQRLFARWSQKRQSIQGTGAYFGAGNPGGMGVLEPNPRWDTALGYSRAFTPAFLLNATLGWGRWVERLEPQGIPFQPSTLGLPAALDNFAGPGAFPGISVTGNQGLGAGVLTRTPREARTFALDLANIRGPHTFTLGFIAIDHRLNTFRSARASFTFPRNFTQGPNPTAADPLTGAGLASFLLGTGNGGGITYATHAALTKRWYGGYFNDDFKLRSNLTLNLGLRYEIQKAPTDRFDRFAYWALERNSISDAVGLNLTGGLRFTGGANPRGLYDPQYTNFAPRLGLTWSPASRLVVRTGFGIFYSSALDLSDIILNGSSQSTPYVGALDGVTPENLLRNPFPSGLLLPPGQSRGDRTDLGLTINAAERRRATPYLEQWTLGLQYQLQSNTVLEASYVGNHGVKLLYGDGPRGFRRNQLRPELLSMGSALLERVSNPFYGTVTTPGSILSGPTATRAQLLRPFPQFDGVNAFQSPGAFSNYHALNLSANRRFSRGLQFLVSYTFSKAMSNNEGPQGWVGNAGQFARNYYDLSLEKSPMVEDTPHSVVISYVYELPVGRGKGLALRNSLANGVLGGWQISGISTFKSGFPLSIYAVSNNVNAFAGIQRPNLAGDPRPDAATVERWFNTTAFAQPPAFAFGNAPRTTPYLRSHGVDNFDFSLQKYWRLWREERRLQFRGEFFNLFNRAGLYAPDTGFGNPGFGRVSQAYPARSIQFGLKLYW